MWTESVYTDVCLSGDIMTLGDEVIIRPDIEVGHGIDNGCYINEDMKSLRGKKAKIKGVYTRFDGRCTYRLSIDHGAWEWTDKMLIPAKQRTE